MIRTATVPGCDALPAAARFRAMKTEMRRRRRTLRLRVPAPARLQIPDVASGDAGQARQPALARQLLTNLPRSPALSIHHEQRREYDQIPVPRRILQARLR